ncbi:MAG: carbamoyltransferase HypF, partial [Clostridia bacterium]|nr:carbamoyltransferase HypF [Clostridia bacterium]
MNQVFHKLHIFGIVQGVGFRPFIALIAEKSGVRGSVCNKGPYVEVFVGGTETQVSDFERRLTDEAPERSNILKVETTEIDSAEFDQTIEEQFAGGTVVDTSEGAEALTDKPFRIIQSEKVKGDIFVSPDIATCPKCEKELFDPGDRRYLHPFINCTACGPRLTILDSMPYDRVRTSMAEFPMCPDCEAEYTSPKTRRYHAQPVCCNDCGPELYLAYDRDGETLRRNDALFKTRRVIRDGGIVAIKGIGGFHLCCDATNEAAVARLRELKDRP